jgi:enoyl-CoA hydratase
VVILRAEGRGFCAGVDIKEINAKGDEALVGVNRGCAAAFAAVYDCEVPVIAAVQGFCLGGGIGIWPATPTWWWPPRTPPSGCPRSTGARSGRPPTWPAWSPSTPCARWSTRPSPSPPPSWPPTARWPRSFPGPPAGGRARAGREIAAKSPTIIRRAKESLNGIDPVDVKRSYRFEQGFTYELHVRGVADEQRAAFVEKRDADTPT